jgi:hypothetical protein
MMVETFLQQYGWLGFLAYLTVKEAWPFFRDRIWPQKVAAQNAERDRIQKLEDRAAEVEERQAKAIESISLSVQQMALAITTNNERLTVLITGHNEHDRFTRDAVTDMRDRVVAQYPPKPKRKVKELERK